MLLIICLGIFGNALSLLVWTRGRRCKKQPGGLYLRALAIADILALCIPAVNEAIRLMSQYNPAHEFNFFCILEIIGRHYGLMVSSWIIVCFTLERTIAIFRPTSSTNLISKKCTVCLIISVYIVNFFFNLPFGIVYGMKEETVTKPLSITWENKTDLHFNGSIGNDSETHVTTESFETGTMIVGYKRRCWADRSSIFHMSRWYHWSMDVFLIFIIPFTLMTGSNLAVLYLVVSNRNKMKSNQDSKVKAVTLRAVTISVVHCLTSGPFAMSVLIPGYYSRAFGIPNSFEYYSSTVILIMAYLNHALNFFLYSVFGSEFKRDCAELMWKKKSTVHPECKLVSHSVSGFTGADTLTTKTSRINKTLENSKSAVSAISGSQREL